MTDLKENNNSTYHHVQFQPKSLRIETGLDQTKKPIYGTYQYTPPQNQRIYSHLPSGREYVSQFNPITTNAPSVLNVPYTSVYSPAQNHFQTGHSAYSNNLQNHSGHQSVSQIYEQRKTEYINRIKRLQDCHQLTSPDKGRYIGQLLKKNPNHNASTSLSVSEQQPLKNGQGIYFYPTGDVYFGGWKESMFHGQGVYIFSTGQIYDGLIQDQVKEGTGTYYYDNNTAFYSGSWHNDVKHGSGVMNSPDEYYEGEWKHGIKHGNGYYKNKISRSVYVGEFFEGIKQGKGRIVYSDGSVYAGQFRNQLPHGVGDFQYPNKDKYIGQFIEGKKHGKGNYFFSEGTIFSGIWNNDSKIQGQLTLFNGDMFNGCFKDNQRYQGTYRYRNGDVYEGTWKSDVKDGFGKLYLQNGQKYQGNFFQGHKHGQGIYTWKNGDHYQGQFAYDKRFGLGQYYWSDGGVYKGEWKDDRMNGYGRLIKDGIDVIGQFFADHFQRGIDELQLGQLRNYVLS